MPHIKFKVESQISSFNMIMSPVIENSVAQFSKLAFPLLLGSFGRNNVGST